MERDHAHEIIVKELSDIILTWVSLWNTHQLEATFVRDICQLQVIRVPDWVEIIMINIFLSNKKACTCNCKHHACAFVLMGLPKTGS